MVETRFPRRALPLAIVGVLAATTGLSAEGLGYLFGGGDRFVREAPARGNIPVEDPYKQLELGVRYDRGKGVPQNHGLAAELYHAAAQQGVPEAQYNLGRIYLEGKHLRADMIKAHMWFNLAIARYPHGATEKRRQAVLARAVAEKRMTARQIDEAQQRALDWRPQ